MATFIGRSMEGPLIKTGSLKSQIIPTFGILQLTETFCGPSYNSVMLKRTPKPTIEIELWVHKGLPEIVFNLSNNLSTLHHFPHTSTFSNEHVHHFVNFTIKDV